MKKLGLLLIGLCFAFSSFSQSIEYEIENVEATKIVKIEWENLHFDKQDSTWTVTVYIKETSYYVIEGDTIHEEVNTSRIKGGIGTF
ncbi:MAG: hypothetical protein GY861_26035, partial [bacterium]|nr:hypothetical protein [bacterium]